MIRITIPDSEAHAGYSWVSRTHAPAIMAAASAFTGAVYATSVLSLREFEGARMRTAQINGCLLCLDFRAARDAPAMFKVGGETPARLVTNNGPAPDEAFYAGVEEWRTSPAFSERERLAIEFAERFALEPKVVSDDEAFWQRMHAAFSDGEIVDLAYSVASWIGMGRVAHVLGFDTVCGAPPVAEAAE